jgi:hypothetical protein
MDSAEFLQPLSSTVPPSLLMVASAHSVLGRRELSPLRRLVEVSYSTAPRL